MSVSGIEASNPNLVLSAPPSSSGSEDKEMFLKLLVAQLRYQDPSNPADSTQFLTQSAQFTTLEKMEQIAAGTEQLVALSTSFGAGGMVGRDVTYQDGNLTRTGTISAVAFSPDGPTFVVDGKTIDMGHITAVHAGSAPRTNPDTDPAEST